MISRREILAAGCAMALGGSRMSRAAAAGDDIPKYLRNHEAIYRDDPRKASLAWFREAKFGLFLHYGLYSLLGRHEWAQLREKIPVAEYAKLKEKFTAEKFDADAIADLAVEIGARYINITTRHHESFSLFKTAQSDFNSVNSPAKRDLVAELAIACDKRGLGLFLYYSHGRDWKHPHAPNNDEWKGSARPKYDPPDPSYAYGKDHDLQKYLDFMMAQITELLTQYRPLAGIWLDGIGVPLSGDRSKFKCQALYDHIHAQQPQVLVSYKQGLIGTEDFFAPERKVVAGATGKPIEICDTVRAASWGYRTGDQLKTREVIAAAVRAARDGGANLLLNTGPRGNGSLDSDDVAMLRFAGEQMRKLG